MKPLRKLSIFAFLTVFNCALTGTVISDFDDSINFNSYSSFVVCVDDLFVEHINYPKYDNNRVRALIAQEIETQMKNKGHITNVPDPQLQVGFQIVLERKSTTFTNCNIHYEFGYWKECTIDTIEYTEETLVVNVSDLKKNQVIWQASATCDLSRSKEALEPYVARLLESLFNEYPLL